MKKQEARSATEPFKEALLDLHLVEEPLPAEFKKQALKEKLVTQQGELTKEGVKAVHAYVAKKNELNWKDK